LLRQLRAEARLTQEELAEAAGLSPRSVSDLERGIHRTAHKDTAGLLAGALGLPGPARALFIAAARGRGLAADVLAARPGQGPGVFQAAVTRALPRDIAAFTGRRAELAQLTGTLAGLAADGGVVGIHAIGGMAGVGKTTFAVHAAHQLAAGFPDGQFFLPLHAHTPGQRPVDAADGLASLLLTAGLPASRIPPGVDARAACWRDQVAGKKILLLLDDAAGHEQVRPLLPGTPGSLVLITSRRRLAALEDAAVLSLDTLPPSEAAALLARLSGRPDLGSGDDPAALITRLCGYLPLAIGMLGRQLAHHPAWTADGLAGELAAARDRLELMAAENLSVAAAFNLSYRDLADGQRRLFRRLGLHPGPDIDAHAAAALDDTSPGQARRRLEDLYDQHLITQPVPGCYQFHDLIREHARTLAAGEPAVRDAAMRLLDYYLQTALTASGHIAARVRGTRPPPPATPPACAPPLSTARQAESWLEAERANLHATAEYAAAHGYREHAARIPAAVSGFLFARGYWDQAAALHRIALAAARRAGDRGGQADALNQLCLLLELSGDNPAAAASQRQALALYRDLGDRRGLADALHSLARVHEGADNYPASIAAAEQALALYRELGDRLGQGDALNSMGFMQQLTGDYPAAAGSLRKALGLFRDVGDRLGQAVALEGLGAVHSKAGDYPAAAGRLQQALELYGDVGDRDGRAVVASMLGMVQRLTGDYPAAAASHRQALELFREVGDRPNQAVTLDEAGVVQRLTGDHAAAAASHQQALNLFGEIGERHGQAGALSNLGAVHTATGDYLSAAASLRRALDVFRDLGVPYGQAETLNNLGELLTRSSASSQARDYYVRALSIARDIGAPLQEARALEGTGQSHIQDGHPADGTTLLRQALAIYQRIGAPDAQRVHKTLRDLSI
jgi:tetratricopeptide (TPR) repeat protein/transcriptional regulator with XRE-family HTH domain